MWHANASCHEAEQDRAEAVIDHRPPSEVEPTAEGRPHRKRRGRVLLKDREIQAVGQRDRDYCQNRGMFGNVLRGRNESQPAPLDFGYDALIAEGAMGYTGERAKMDCQNVPTALTYRQCGASGKENGARMGNKKALLP